jgi:hypothetical protein
VSKLAAAAGIVCAFAIGVLVARFPFLKWVNEVSFVDLFGILVAVALAIIAGAYLPEAFQSARVQRQHAADLTRQAMTQVMVLVERTRELYRTGSAPQTRITELTDPILELRSLLELLHETVSSCNLKGVALSIGSVTTRAKNLRALLTKNSATAYTTDEFSSIERTLQDLRQRLNLVIVALG